MPIVKLAAPLRRFCENKAEIRVEGKNLREVIMNLDKQYKGFASRILEGNEIKDVISIFINNEDVRMKKGLDTEVKEEDVIFIAPAIAGGRCQ